MGPPELRSLVGELQSFIDPETDSLTAWPTAENGHAQILHIGMPRMSTHEDYKLI